MLKENSSSHTGLRPLAGTALVVLKTFVDLCAACRCRSCCVPDRQCRHLAQPRQRLGGTLVFRHTPKGQFHERRDISAAGHERWAGDHVAANNLDAENVAPAPTIRRVPHPRPQLGRARHQSTEEGRLKNISTPAILFKLHCSAEEHRTSGY